MIFKNVVHGLEPGETVRCGLGAVAVIFSIYLNSVLYVKHPITYRCF